jgi:hypothetical protein
MRMVEKAIRLPFKESSFLMSADMGRSENGWKGCKTKRVERLSNVYGLHWLDRRKTIDIVKNRRILQPIAKNHLKSLSKEATRWNKHKIPTY